MKFLLSSITQFLELKIDDMTNLAEQVTNRLTHIGFEASFINTEKNLLESFVVGEILSVEQHPKADRLRVVQVRYMPESKGEQLQIICGAKNLTPGAKIVLARAGCIIPLNKTKIRKSKIRGIISEAMICSFEELGLEKKSSEEEEIIELPREAKIGESVEKYLGIEVDELIEVDITPNRVDVMCAYGIARELAGSGFCKMKSNLFQEPTKTSFPSNISLGEIDKTICNFFSLREIRNIRNDHKTPTWLKERLHKLGINLVSPLVDIVNYVTYILGQPLHLYDLSKIKNDKISVLKLKRKNLFRALNHETYEIGYEDIVIQDKNSGEIHSLAGIIGSELSAVSSTTSEILIESAVFSAESISKTGDRLGIHNVACGLFEKKLTSYLSIDAINYAAELILKICTQEDGGQLSELVIFSDELDRLYREKSIIFPYRFLESYSGLKIDSNEVKKILLRLGFYIEPFDEYLRVKIPKYRTDVEGQEDLVEEIIRIYGYDKIPSINLPVFSRAFVTKESQLLEIRKILAFRGYNENISFSFVNKEYAKLFTDISDKLEIINPISAEMNYLRYSALPSLLEWVAYNLRRSIKNFSLFEIGPSFRLSKSQNYSDSVIEENDLFLCAIRVGLREEKGFFSKKGEEFDLFDLKTDLEVIIDHFRINKHTLEYSQENRKKYFCPGRFVSVLGKGGETIAEIGEIDPKILSSYKILGQKVLVMEVDLEAILQYRYTQPLVLEMSNFPQITRDYSFLIKKSYPIGELIKFLSKLDRNIKSVRLLDIYQDSDKSQHSVSVSLNIQNEQKTLSNEEISKIHDRIIVQSQKEFDCVVKNF